MKKILLSVLLVSGYLLADAQADTTLQQYTGKYKFPEGSPVTEIGVVIDNGILTATSSMGNSELKKTEGDVFEIVAYGGTATFKRNTDNKINGVLIQVQDVTMEGTKTEGIVFENISGIYPGKKHFKLY